MQVSATVMDFN